jgi:hypothetical protein
MKDLNLVWVVDGTTLMGFSDYTRWQERQNRLRQIKYESFKSALIRIVDGTPVLGPLDFTSWQERQYGLKQVMVWILTDTSPHISFSLPK